MVKVVAMAIREEKFPFVLLSSLALNECDLYICFIHIDQSKAMPKNVRNAYLTYTAGC